MAGNSFASNNIEFDEPINIDGQFEQSEGPQRMSSSDRLRILRRRLEKRNEQMIRKKMEQTRVQMEMMLMKQMQQKMNSIYKNMQ
jgi:hypothetical protein